MSTREEDIAEVRRHLTGHYWHDLGPMAASMADIFDGLMGQVGYVNHEHKAQVGISFSDDGATLICQREECMENPTLRGDGTVKPFWWQREIPYMCTPEVAAEYRDKHLRGEDW